ncbi:MAG: sulfurtransferase [Nitrospirota bacterium]
MGYTNVKVYIDGLPEWKKAGNLVLSTIGDLKNSMDKDIPHILLDVRPEDDAKAGFINGAVSLPAEDINASKGRFPTDKTAPVILYSQDSADLTEAFKVIRGWGYKNASVLKGGIKAWKEAGYPLSTGALKTSIAYIPKPKPGVISADEFKKVAATLPADKMILDVRIKDEAVLGMLKGAINIPAQDITARLSELPKEKEIIAHCTTGARAEMTYHALKEAGYKVRFLNAAIKIDKDGKYEITTE